jgi:mannose-1-phosphate guanylyltransferase
VHYLYEPELLGTAGAFANLRRQHGLREGTGLVVYGDNLLRLDVAALLADHREHDAACTVALFDRAVHRHTGIAGGRVELAADGRIVGFVEGAGAPSPGIRDLVNAGVYAIEPEVTALIPAAGASDFGRDVFPAMLAAGDRLYGHVLEEGGYCLGLDTPASYAAGVALLGAGGIGLA